LSESPQFPDGHVNAESVNRRGGLKKWIARQSPWSRVWIPADISAKSAWTTLATGSKQRPCRSRPVPIWKDPEYQQGSQQKQRGKVKLKFDGKHIVRQVHGNPKYARCQAWEYKKQRDCDSMHEFQSVITTNDAWLLCYNYSKSCMTLPVLGARISWSKKKKPPRRWRSHIIHATVVESVLWNPDPIRKIKKKLIILSRLTTLMNLFQQFKLF
jgi:hypothetical protein